MAVSQELTLTEVAGSQNISGNTSKVRILWKSTQSGESYNGYTKTAYYWVTTPDGKETKYSVSYALPKGTTKTILDTTITITHKDDGSGTVKVRTWMDTGISAGEITQSKTLTLETIARAAKITSAVNVTLGKVCQIKWTPAAASMRYKLEFSLGDWKHTTGVIHPNQTTAYTYSGYTIPLELANRITSGKTGTVTVKLYTYSDSGGTKQVGSADTETFQVTVPELKPTVSMTLAAVSSLPSLFAKVYVQGKSKVQAAITATALYGAEIQSVRMEVEGKTYTGDFTSDYLNQYGSITVTAYATDSRGYTGSAVQSITVLPYSKPQILPATGESKVVAVRCDANGQPTDSGTYMKIKARRGYSKVLTSQVQYNTCDIRYQYKAEDAEKWSQWETILLGYRDEDEVETGALLGGVLAADKSYLVKVGVIDDVGGTASTTVYIPTDRVYMHQDKVRRALAFGMYIQDDNTIDVAEDITVRVRGELVTGGNGWITPTLGDHFELYSTGADNAVRYRRIAGIVEIRGAVKPKEVIPGSSDEYTIFTLPEEYRPDNVIRAVCKGSHWHHWLLMVRPNGVVSFSRYSDGNGYLDTPSTAWLPFQLTFIADQ